MKWFTRAFSFAVCVVLATSAGAAEIKVFCTNGVKAVVEELIPQFERTNTNGDKVVLQFEPLPMMRDVVENELLE